MLKSKVCGIEFDNPLLLAAGVMGSTASSLNWALDSGAAGVVTKSFSIESNEGYKNPTTVAVEGGILNAIGLSSQGVENFKEELEKVNGITIASIYGSNPSEFEFIVGEINDLVDCIELNVSCPHAMCGYGSSIGVNPELTQEIVKASKKSSKVPIWTKLTPNVTDIKEIAIAAEKGGSDGITAINTVGPGMKIDIKTAKPVLYNKFGGMSGPAIHPVAVRMVHETAQAVKIPIVGMGGIRNAEDAIEMILAGASAVAVGTANFTDPEICEKIVKGIEEYMMQYHVQDIRELIGAVHE